MKLERDVVLEEAYAREKKAFKKRVADFRVKAQNNGMELPCDILPHIVTTRLKLQGILCGFCKYAGKK